MFPNFYDMLYDLHIFLSIVLHCLESCRRIDDLCLHIKRIRYVLYSRLQYTICQENRNRWCRIKTYLDVSQEKFSEYFRDWVSVLHVFAEISFPNLGKEINAGNHESFSFKNIF